MAALLALASWADYVDQGRRPSGPVMSAAAAAGLVGGWFAAHLPCPQVCLLLVTAAACGLLVRRGAERGKGPACGPGQVWWAWLPFEDSPDGKDRPVLVVKDSGGRHVWVCKITSKSPHARVAAHYRQVSCQGWDRRQGPSWLDTRRRRVPRSNLRRYAGAMQDQV